MVRPLRVALLDDNVVVVVQLGKRVAVISLLTVRLSKFKRRKFQKLFFPQNEFSR